jgi:hypothetical protein
MQALIFAGIVMLPWLAMTIATAILRLRAARRRGDADAAVPGTAA